MNTKQNGNINFTQNEGRKQIIIINHNQIDELEANHSSIWLDYLLKSELKSAGNFNSLFCLTLCVCVGVNYLILIKKKCQICDIFQY